MDDQSLQTAEGQESGIGPSLSIAVLVLLFAAGGLYFLFEENRRLHTPPIEQTIGATSTPQSASSTLQ